MVTLDFNVLLKKDISTDNFRRISFEYLVCCIGEAYFLNSKDNLKNLSDFNKYNNLNLSKL